jgi:hypothetical protein
MRPIHLLAVASAVSALATPLGAQDRESADRAVTIMPGSGFARVWDGGEFEANRAALGVGTSATGTLRDTLGLMITSITRGGPAERAGLEEGNRLAAINGVSLRANAADIEDYQLSGTLVRRLTRELSRVKPGDEVELRVHRDGRTQAIKVRTASSDSLFRRSASTYASRSSREDQDDRPALGFSLGSSGSVRDTLGVLVMGVPDSTPAARAGLEEGNRIASINGVNLRVAREDAGDRHLGSAKAQRLRREISQLKPGDDVRLRVYGNGQWRDVTMKVARARDLPRTSWTFFGGDGMIAPMPPMPVTPAMPAMPRTPMAPRVRWQSEPIRIEIGPELRRQIQDARVQFLDELRPELERLRPELERVRTELPRMLEHIRIPDVDINLDMAPPRTTRERSVVL